MDIFEEEELAKWITVLTKDFCKRNQRNAWLFSCRMEFTDFINSSVCEGIAIAFARLEEYEAWFESGGESERSFYEFVWYKCNTVIRDGLRVTRRQKQSFSSQVLNELWLLKPTRTEPTRELELREVRRECKERMSLDQYYVLLLVDYVGCSAKDASWLMGRSLPAIYTLLKRARRRFSELHREVSKQSVVASEPKAPKKASRKPRDDLPDSELNEQPGNAKVSQRRRS